MRLLSAEDLQFEDFFGRKIPKYAILSHRWEEEEPSYADMKTTIVQRKAWGTGQESPWEGQIYQKIYQFSLMALQAGYKYIWVDTCCIDKSSSAELQESINSMYQWYMDSGVCYVYLSDVSISASPSSTRHRGPLSSRPWTESFQNSQWFTRGWTLQELLAPRDLVFFDKDWNRCGNRAELQDAIEAATGIDAASLTNASLKDGTYLRSIRLGRLFSWTAGRQTTRREDRAYSLLGLFNVNMPLLYGEKDRAFYRLQEEIIKESEDASLLAWAYTEADDGFAPNGLAKSPSQFHKYQNLMTKDLSRIPYVAFSPRMIARGLQVALSIRMDPFEKRLGYAVLAHEINRRSLVLPVLFCSLTFVRTLVQNECVRFSDPVWVPSRFVSKAKPRSICFIRHVEATHLFEPGHGLSLGSAVWKSYTTTFTYPIQTQAGRRHFPALLGRFTILPEQREKNFTFIVELTARTNAKRIYVVIINYRSCGTDLAADMTITVLRCKWHINLAYAMDLVQRRGNRKSCELPDEYGGAIPTADIVYISPVTSLWVAEAENGLDKASSHPRKDIEVNMLGFQTLRFNWEAETIWVGQQRPLIKKPKKKQKEKEGKKQALAPLPLPPPSSALPESPVSISLSVRETTYSFSNVTYSRPEFSDEETMEPVSAGARKNVDGSSLQMQDRDYGERCGVLPDQVEIRMLVSGQHLALASSYFAKMFASPFTEAETDQSGLRQVKASEWDPEAFNIILTIIHGYHRDVPRIVSLEMLAKLAIIVDYYGFHESIELHADIWLENLKSEIPTVYGRDCILYMLISWVFTKSDIFQKMTRLALQQSRDLIGSEGLPLPTHILEKIDEERQDSLDDIFTAIYHLLDRLQEETECSYECSSMSLGVLTKELSKHGILSPRIARPFCGWSIDGSRDMIKGLRQAHWYDKHAVRHGNRHSCTIQQKLSPALMKVEDELRVFGFPL